MHPSELLRRQRTPLSGALSYLKSMPSVGSVLDTHRGAGPGFDAIRIGLSVAILLWHCFPLTGGAKAIDTATTSVFFPFMLGLVPAFFLLSGFLVTGSALRTQSVKTFLINRGLRILPALAVEVMLAALILGPILTSFLLKDYFSNEGFFQYFGNIVGLIRFKLPGLFLSNPYPEIVNGSLWTLRPEYYCYLIMTILMLIKLVNSKSVFSWAFIAATVALTIFNVTTGWGTVGQLAPSFVVVFCFVAGIFLFHWRYHIRLNVCLFIGCAVWSYFMINQRLIFLTVLSLGYCVVYIGMIRIPPIPLLKRGDYSYGIYLFGFPIQQTVVYLFPSVREWWFLFLIALPVTITFAALSWHFIEKPTLKLKHRFQKKSALPAA